MTNDPSSSLNSKVVCYTVYRSLEQACMRWGYSSPFIAWCGNGRFRPVFRLYPSQFYIKVNVEQESCHKNKLSSTMPCFVSTCVYNALFPIYFMLIVWKKRTWYWLAYWTHFCLECQYQPRISGVVAVSNKPLIYFSVGCLQYSVTCF